MGKKHNLKNKKSKWANEMEMIGAVGSYNGVGWDP